MAGNNNLHMSRTGKNVARMSSKKEFVRFVVNTSSLKKCTETI